MILKILKNRRRVLGLNERNISYIKKYNSARSRRIADNKILTKKVLDGADIPTTKIIKVLKTRAQLAAFDLITLPHTFVVKPDSGVAGQGIEIVYNRDKNGDFIATNGEKYSPDMLRALMESIVEGEYSLTHAPDKVLIEERVRPHKKFRPYIWKGTPDIRIIVFKRVPIMAMVRWPTRDSKGRANFAQGAVGSGIDLATGITTHSVKASLNGGYAPIEYVENTRIHYSGFKVPYWERMLKYAVAAARATGLGYCAADFLIDRDLGPMIVELNARPGLSIQLANQDGIKWRLEQVKFVKAKSDAHGIRIGKDLFGGEVEEEIEAVAGKKLISIIEPVKIYYKSGRGSTTVKAKVDTGAYYSSIDIKLAKELGYKEAIDLFNGFNVPEIMNTEREAKEWKEKLHQTLIDGNEHIVNTHVIGNSNGHSYRIAVELKCKIGDKVFTIESNVKDRSQLKFPMILGRRSMGDFLVDPTRKIHNV